MKKSTENILQLWENWQKKKKAAMKKMNSFQDQEIMSISLDGEFIRMPKYFVKLKMYNSEIEIF